MELILLNGLFILLIIGIIYWFWGNPSPKAECENTGSVIDICVDQGVYTPSSIQTQVNQPLHLRFTRHAASACAATVVFSEFDQSIELPLAQAVEIELMPDRVGEFTFTCEMGMYRGRLIVVAA